MTFDRVAYELAAFQVRRMVRLAERRARALACSAPAEAAAVERHLTNAGVR